MSTFDQNGSNDLVLKNGRLVIVRDRATACAIKLRNRFYFFLGEWFIDTRLGVPYLQYVYKKSPDLGLIRQLFRKVILETPPVEEVVALNLSFDAASRTLSFSFRARIDDGRVIAGGTGEPFIVEAS